MDLDNPEFLVLMELIQGYIDFGYALKYTPLEKLWRTYPQFDWKVEEFPPHVPDDVIIRVAQKTNIMWLMNTKGSWKNGVVTATFKKYRGRPSSVIYSGPNKHDIWGLLPEQPWARSGDPDAV